MQDTAPQAFPQRIGGCATAFDFAPGALNDPWFLFVDFRVSLKHTWRLPGTTDIKRGTGALVATQTSLWREEFPNLSKGRFGGPVATDYRASRGDFDQPCVAS